MGYLKKLKDTAEKDVERGIKLGEKGTPNLKKLKDTAEKDVGGGAELGKKGD